MLAFNMNTVTTGGTCNKCGRVMDTCGSLVLGMCAACALETLTQQKPLVEHIPFPNPELPYGYGQRGWICPVCGAGLSPYTSRCPCQPPPFNFQGTWV